MVVRSYLDIRQVVVALVNENIKLDVCRLLNDISRLALKVTVSITIDTKLSVL